MRLTRFALAIFVGRFVRFTIESILVVRYGPQVIAVLADVFRHHVSYLIAAAIAVLVVGWWIWRVRRSKRRTAITD